MSPLRWVRTRIVRGAQDEQGFTLIELLVTMTLMGIIGGIAVTSMATATRVQSRQLLQVEAMNQMKLAFERVTTDIRAADPLITAGPTSLTTRVCRTTGYANRTYQVVSGGNLRDWANRTLAEGLSYPAGSTLFSYTLEDGTTVTTTDASNIGKVRFVTVRLRRPVTGGATIDLSDKVAIRNTGVNTCP